MKKTAQILFISLIIFFSQLTRAIECPITMPDLSASLKTLPSVEMVTRYSGESNFEAYYRYMVRYDDNSLMIFEQKNCQIYNLTVSLLSTNSDKDKKTKRILNALMISPLIQKEFEQDKLNSIIKETIEKAVANVSKQANSINLSNSLQAKRIHSEVYFDYKALGEYLPFYTDSYSFYFAAGMND